MTAPNPAADVRQMIEDVKARHEPVETENQLGQCWDVCNVCNVSWPCDAAQLADMLEQAVTALEAAKRLAFYASPLLTLEDSKREYDPLAARSALDEFRTALRRMAGGDGE